MIVNSIYVDGIIIKKKRKGKRRKKEVIGNANVKNWKISRYVNILYDTHVQTNSYINQLSV